MTGLPNRTLLYDRLEQAIRHGARDRRPFALLLLDLDRFKEVNDSLGHLAGDRLLCQVAARLTGLLRAQDTVARLGGDEFAVILPGADAANSAAIAASLFQALDLPIDLDQAQVTVGTSVGVAVFPEHGLDAETLMRRADLAMYAAKRAGSGPVVYDPAQDTRLLSAATA